MVRSKDFSPSLSCMNRQGLKSLSHSKSPLKRTIKVLKWTLVRSQEFSFSLSCKKLKSLLQTVRSRLLSGQLTTAHIIKLLLLWRLATPQEYSNWIDLIAKLSPFIH